MKNINLTEKIKENKKTKEIVLPIMYSYKQKKEKALKEKNEKEFKKELKNIKKEALKNIKKLKETTIKNLEKNNIKVFEAKTPKETIEFISNLTKDEKTIIKSKSNTANEINLNEELKEKEIIETDLGDYLNQLFENPELHPVLPAMNLTPKEITKKIKEKFNIELEAKPEKILEFVREHLRKKIYKSKTGITGANVISSDGSIFILENEGNISLVSRIPEKHIILTSFEKIVKTREDALKIIEASAIYGTGQNYPMYVNIISGPSKTADIQNQLITGAQGAKQVYLILLDNKREEILNSEFKELLHCINCGACLNLCPVYNQIFNNYGAKYFPGAKGVISSYFKESNKESYKNGAFFCTTCKQCQLNCPLDIKLSKLIKKLRERLVQEGIEPDSAKQMIQNIKKYGNPFGDKNKKIKCDKLYCC